VVSEGQPIADLAVFLSAEAKTTIARSLVDAESAMAGAQVKIDAATLALDRAERLLRAEAGSQRAVDDAKAQLLLARSEFESARKGRDLLDALAKDDSAGGVPPYRIRSPLAGVLTALHAAPGQLVTQGAPLFEVADLSRLWIRVAVYVGELAEIDASREAQIGDLNGTPDEKTRPAEPVSAPPSADPAAATVDLFYAIDNGDGGLRPGQRVGATIPLKGAGPALTVPRTAILYDMDGGAWVYEKTGDHIYTRRRVEVRAVAGDLAVLARGPAAGARIVTDGAAELFGTEFGTGK
ncbi:MAG: efflux RND transporter periplasmic adaptor subunit, partial [Planctomycetes bacterium]|nr:efflux RND transporter periplasmic adaptor subunit [Planctomycetota bacterium]